MHNQDNLQPQPEPVKAGVIGYPVTHSLSPLIHSHWIDRYGYSGTYEQIQIIPEQFHNAIHHIRSENLYDGFNVTLPYKEGIMDYCDEIEDTAKRIGAVNTVVIDGGKMIGRNTDAFGFIANFKNYVPDYKFDQAPALILGAGGAARAVVYGLCKAGVKDIYITNRTAEKAEKIAKDFASQSCTCHVVEWDDRLSSAREAGLVVNTTSLGMTGKDELDFDVSALPDTACVYDIVYSPHHTKLLTDALNRDLKIVTGIGMLLHQARPAFESWFGVLPDIDEELIRKVTER